MRHFPYTDHEFPCIDHKFLSIDHKFLSIDRQFQVMEPICDTCNEELQRIVAERKSVEAHRRSDRRVSAAFEKSIADQIAIETAASQIEANQLSYDEPKTPEQVMSDESNAWFHTEAVAKVTRSQSNQTGSLSPQISKGTRFLCPRAQCARGQNYYKTGTLFPLSKSIGVFNPELL